jgi:magnesium and cobalt transporter
LRDLFDADPQNREEVIDILRDAAGDGVLDRDTLNMLEGVMGVADLRVRDIMVPRAQMDVVDFSRAPDEFLPVVVDSGHSRFPVIDADKDRVIGILLAKDLLRYLQLDRKKRARFNLRDMLRPAVFVPESKRLNVLLREFKASRNHMAIVVDEYGGVGGLVTIEDVIEQIVGEIRDEYDIEADDVMIVEREGGEYVVKAQAPLDDFNARFAAHLAQGDIDTVGGIVMARLGRVPRRGEKIEFDGLRFEVLRADSRRVHLLKVARLAAAT